MNESISRAAGASHGQITSPSQMNELILAAGRIPKQRNTLYGQAPASRIDAGIDAGALADVINTPIARRSRGRARRIA